MHSNSVTFGLGICKNAESFRGASHKSVKLTVSLSSVAFNQCSLCCFEHAFGSCHGPRNDFIVGVAKGQLLPKIYKYAYKNGPHSGANGGRGGPGPPTPPPLPRPMAAADCVSVPRFCMELCLRPPLWLLDPAGGLRCPYANPISEPWLRPCSTLTLHTSDSPA